MAPRHSPLAFVAAVPAVAHRSFAVHFVADRLVTGHRMRRPGEFLYLYDRDPSYGE